MSNSSRVRTPYEDLLKPVLQFDRRSQASSSQEVLRTTKSVFHRRKNLSVDEFLNITKPNGIAGYFIAPFNSVVDEKLGSLAIKSRICKDTKQNYFLAHIRKTAKSVAPN